MLTLTIADSGTNAMYRLISLLQSNTRFAPVSVRRHFNLSQLVNRIFGDSREIASMLHPS
jgi:hypothetical protein